MNKYDCIFILGIRRCEIDHRASCDFTRECSYETGRISSLGYPEAYPQRSTCTWRIITDLGSYITMTFVDFDIKSLGFCDSSSLYVYNGQSLNEDLLIGQYCNDRSPPAITISAFNQLFLRLLSGAEEAGNGFVMDFVQKTRVSDHTKSPGKSFIIHKNMFCITL